MSTPPLKLRTFRTSDEIDRAIAKLRRRMVQLANLDVRSAALNRTEEEGVVEESIRRTVLEIFGENSPEYREHQYITIWAGPMSVRMSPDRIQSAMELGQKKVLGILQNLIDDLEEKKAELGSAPPSRVSTADNRRVFIGHGRSSEWRKLKDFLVDRLHVEYEEFDRESPAGYSVKERLEQMLESTRFAFLIMTAEDEHADGSHHARENVIHEIGLFQGRHGFTRAIVLLENGCTEFSNIHGLVQIRFPQGDLTARSEDIRKVLEREGMLE